jgi:methylglyoxal reductase
MWGCELNMSQRNKVFPNFDRSISKLGYGAMGLGGAFGHYAEKDYVNSVLNCLDQGINFIDTARLYGDSERIIGLALKQWKDAPPFIATKARPSGQGGWGSAISSFEDYPPGSIRDSLIESLRKLQLESIDLLQLHRYWGHWEHRDHWMEELVRLKEEGLIRHIGISLPDHRHELALELVRSECIDSVQTILNIFDPLSLDCLASICQKHNVALIARCVLDEGGLTGFLREDTLFEKDDFRSTFFNHVPRNYYINKVNQLCKFIPSEAQSLAQLAIKFAIKHPAVTTAIISMHIIAYANENIETLNQPPLSDPAFQDIFQHHRWIRNFYESLYW